MSKVKDQLKQLTIEQLAVKISSLREELFSMRLNAVNTHVKDYSQFSKLRKDIARALTYIHQKVKNHIITVKGV
jgi:large subunit ribosomal protein L29